MKRLISVALALSLLGSSAAFARDSGRDWHGSYGHSAPYRGGYGYRDHNNGAAAAVGLGILALGVFGALAAQNNNQYDRDYYAPPPRYNYGYSNYGYSYGPNYGYSGSYSYGR
jgi:hypothetical protein